MDGITILNTGEYFVRRTGGFNITFLLCLILFCASIFGFLGCFKASYFDRRLIALALILMVPWTVVLISSWKIFGGEKITIPEYKVTIDNSITYKDFTDKYKVIEQEGQIYTIIDKEELAVAEKK